MCRERQIREQGEHIIVNLVILFHLQDGTVLGMHSGEHMKYWVTDPIYLQVMQEIGGVITKVQMPLDMVVNQDRELLLAGGEMVHIFMDMLL